MNKTFPRSFCISLKETPLRTEKFLELAKKSNLDTVIFYGVLGNKVGLIPQFPNSLECSDRNIFVGTNAIGCNLSHFMLWKHLMYLDEDEFLVFEDDAIITEDFRDKFSELYKKLPDDWQFVYVGWIPFGKDKNPISVTDGISIRTPAATHAYLIKKSALNVLINGMYPFQSNIDLTIIERCLPNLKHYVFDPSIVSQRSYANTKDPTWMSLVYDWKSDLYGFKRNMLNELSLEKGWYNLECAEKEYWIWSSDKFSIKLPKVLENIYINCSVPVKNIIEISFGDKKLNFDLSAGNNTINVPVKGSDSIIGKIDIPFIPSENDSSSSDNRQLGICLKSCILDIGVTNITVEAKDF